ncbi:hypothetical protein [Aurantibacter sp.]|uniref:hypothetical protein n=1 Tax=Aurantibacter sp. TaxID=2807103 RepID=UPI0035C86239
MKTHISLLLNLCFFVGVSQVGIGTITPEEELHIAGSTSTIRIDALNTSNNPTKNPTGKLVKAYVDANGDITFGSGFGTAATEPLNFLIDVPNFIDDDPYTLGYGSGTVINSPIGSTTVEGTIKTIPFNAPQDATVEVKYGITLLVAGNDLSTSVPTAYVTYEKAVTMVTYFCVDIDSNGLDATEKAIRHGYKGQSYETNYGGSIGYPYMNSQGYLTVPAGNHTLYFFGVTTSDSADLTSVGYGGDKDYLKIRIYN